ncbi:MAG: hypothetical protein A3F09_02130 [Chlamydiae bacterium RIFCSPHIGHO2_12_FULL_49_11]|nr:MAG: hypothetical protein A3F09_02130 [Chlamydiae bacterium RIFCSPHIGHO2_12_FULL_49_11]
MKKTSCICIALVAFSCTPGPRESGDITLQQQQFQSEIETDIAKVKNDTLSINFSLDHLEHRLEGIKSSLEQIQKKEVGELRDTLVKITERHAELCKMQTKIEEGLLKLEESNIALHKAISQLEFERKEWKARFEHLENELAAQKVRTITP